MNFKIKNCEYQVKYKCPLKWSKLKETKDSKIRFCNECNKNVYFCKTSKDIDKHIKLNNCIVVDVIDQDQGQYRTMGVIELGPYVDFDGEPDDDTPS